MDNINLHSTLFSNMKYLDPGSGSIFLQLLLSSILGVGIYLLSKFEWLRKIFHKDPGKADEESFEDDFLDG